MLPDMAPPGPLSVGVDYLPASRHAPGVGRYARELVRALVQELGPAGEADDLTLRLLELGREPVRVHDLGVQGLSPRPHVTRRRLPLPRRLLGARWFPAADTLLGGVDVFQHIVATPTRVRRARQVATLSELPPAGSAAAALEAQRLAAMDAVLVFGEAAARAARDDLGVPAERVHVVPVGCDHWSRGLWPEALARSGLEDLPDGLPEIAVLGTPRAERSPEFILEAHERLRAAGLPCRLRFVGGPAPEGSPLPALVAARDDVRHELPSEGELRGTLMGAAVLVHLSAAEATAVTPLEAFSFGLPVVASDRAAFREALDDEATLLPDGADAEALADAVAAALSNRTDEDARARRRAVADRFTWRRNAAATLVVWHDLAARGPR